MGWKREAETEDASSGESCVTSIDMWKTRGADSNGEYDGGARCGTDGTSHNGEENANS